jgi:hypothetical protein
LQHPGLLEFVEKGAILLQPQSVIHLWDMRGDERFHDEILSSPWLKSMLDAVQVWVQSV